MKFKKVGENQHGAITQVKNDKGFHVGNITKWNGLFIPVDWRGEVFAPRNSRTEAAEVLNENFEFELGASLN